MMRWLGPSFVLLVAAILAHVAVLYSAPSLIMSRAMTMLAERSAPLHDFTLSPRITPETQRVVRPSPDLAYSLCMFDMTTAPDGLRVRMAAYVGYGSLSFFGDNTDNFLTVRGDGKAHEVRLLPPDAEAGEAGTVVAPSDRGMILIRRLAPTQQDYNAVRSISAGDRCEAL